MRRDKQFLFQISRWNLVSEFPVPEDLHHPCPSFLASPGTPHPKEVNFNLRSWKSDVPRGLGKQRSIQCENKSSSLQSRACKSLRFQFFSKRQGFLLSCFYSLLTCCEAGQIAKIRTQNQTRGVGPDDFLGVAARNEPGPQPPAISTITCTENLALLRFLKMHFQCIILYKWRFLFQIKILVICTVDVAPGTQFVQFSGKQTPILFSN